LTILPGYYFGDIAYYTALLQSENAIIDFHENYIKQSQRNHTVISGPNGIVKLSMPIHKASKDNRRTGNIKIDHSENTSREHLNSIKTAYSPSPFFESFFPLVEQFYSIEYTNLKEAHLAAFNVVDSVIQIDGKLKYSQQYSQAKESDIDLRVKNNFPSYKFSNYSQVFQDRHGFIPNLSILDLIFNEGKWARKYLIDNSI